MAKTSMAKPRKQSRYKVIEQVGSGDFAKVYSAEDTKLGRKVAIKQLHRQYLEDEDKLSRYWKEAQLLVELEHPNIMTIYDVVKDKGCLVLELMQGSLNQIYGDKPMPVSDVRETIIEVCKGLECLHENGIIHGDIKPGNLMLGRSNVVKLGDFGLARRASDAEGSLVKGTTKYMAPELVSEEFGDVGPQSDLYSLGFAALELLVGPDFDSLFPDLIAFGRDKQMAWMMWHCSKDRRFPPVKTILDGVPDDLANVLEKLTSKDQSKRYKTAREAISELKSGAKPVGQSVKEEQERLAELARKQKRKRRIIAASACFTSLCLSAFILWYMLTPPPEPPVVKQPPPVSGVVKNVLGRDEKFVIDPGTGDWKEFELRNGDTVTLSRAKRQLRDLKIGDRVVVYTRLTEDVPPKYFYDVVAFRPESHSGEITSVNVEEGLVKVQVINDEGENGELFDLKVTEETKIIVNKKAGTEEEPLTIESLAENDVVDIDISDDTDGMLALTVDALRVVSFEGVIRKLEPRKGTMTIADNSGGAEEIVELPLDPKCVFTLNGVKSVDDKLLTASDIKVGDAVKIKHDIKITSIDAYRPFEDMGRITAVGYGQKQFTLKSRSATAPITYRVDDKTQIMLGGEVVSLDELRPNDEAQLNHDMPDEESPTILSLNVTRPVNRKRWAILVGIDDFDAPEIPALKTSVSNVDSIKEMLIGRFGVPEAQVKVFENEARVRLEQELPQMIGRASSGGELYVYFATRGFVEPDKNAYLATRDFKVADMEETGIDLDWLIDLMDNSPASKKILMLDCATDTKAGDSTDTTTSQMVQHIQNNRRGGYPKYTYVLANMAEGQSALDSLQEANKSVFGQAISEAFSGKADKERDTKVEITEFAKYVTERTSALAATQSKMQTPYLFTPDDRPPRLSDAIQEQIVELLSEFSNPQKDVAQVISRGTYISNACNGEPEPVLATGLILIKRGKVNEALRILEEVRLKHRSYLLSQQAVIWIHFYKRHYDVGAAKLLEMLKAIPTPEKGETISELTYEKIEWVGRLRELAGNSANWNQRIPTSDVLSAIDSALVVHGEEAKKRFETGREGVRKIIDEFNAELKNNPESDADLDRRRIQSYIPPIASPKSIQEIQDGLDNE